MGYLTDTERGQEIDLTFVTKELNLFQTQMPKLF